MPEGLYDHCPCIVRFDKVIIRRAKAFKYFNMWKLDENFETTIDSIWRQEVDGNMMFRVVYKMKQLKKAFRRMDNENFSDIEKRVDLMQLALQQCQQNLWDDPLNQDLLTVEKCYATELTKFKKKKDDYLQQKSKCD